ncbi:hypothetical protein OG429_13425 [Streptomyces sp. NBC_00190]|uniref:hypothetical protein n=1 Tax=unclassified Streptomyces TaxID=2593676 RepID=UPI002E156887|nr:MULTISPECIES: hypothetical protein [unclassified Streptomyces]WSP89660.1 hypothetical protein OG332_14325 [Streptomyces sp. NBC_01233]
MGYDFFIVGENRAIRGTGPNDSLYLSAFQGASVIDTMAHFGMTVEKDRPQWPTFEEYGVDPADFSDTADLTEERQKAKAAFVAAYQAVREAADDEPDAIPAYKLRFCDGFWVTPSEIAAALNRYEAHPNYDCAELPFGDQTWARWIAFLRVAQAAGGLRTV